MPDVFHKDFPELFPEHVEELKRSGIADDVIRERHYESVLGAQRLIDLGFAKYQARKPGLLLPIMTPDGANGLYQYKPDFPRTDRADKVFKYETPARSGLRLDVPPRCRPMLGDPSIPLYITEGIKKGDAGASHGLCVIDVMGVWGFRGKNDFGGTTWLSDWQYIALDDRVVNICYDSDVMTKPQAKRALDTLTDVLHHKGANVRHVYLPNGANGEKVGLDDFLLVHQVHELDRYTVTPTTTPEPKQPPLFYQLAPGDERHLSDVGNAYRLVATHGENLRYCHAWGKWLVFTGTHWTVDVRGQVVSWAKHAVRSIYGEAIAAVESEQATALAKWAIASEGVTRIEAMIKLAKDELSITPQEMDVDPWLFNCANGTIDLRTGELQAHAREDFLTKISPIPYIPNAKCRQFNRFLIRIMGGNRTLVRFVRKAIGYSLTGDVTEQVLFFLYGIGANGKSTLLNAILGVMGDYGKQAAPGILTVKSGESHPTELADLAGTRFLSTVEITEGREMAEALVKQITGGDPIRARRMREDFWSFMPSHKIFLAANHKPVIKGTDGAIWRRIRLVPFTIVIPKENRDLKLGDKLKAEYAGILAWAMRGCLEWQRDGLGYPEAIEAATKDYQKEMDVLASFLADCCLVDKHARVAKGTLYKEYREWCAKNGEKDETQRVLSGRMVERGFGEVRGSKGLRLWLGVGIQAKDDENG